MTIAFSHPAHLQKILKKRKRNKCNDKKVNLGEVLQRVPLHHYWFRSVTLIANQNEQQLDIFWNKKFWFILILFSPFKIHTMNHVQALGYKAFIVLFDFDGIFK